MIWPEDPRAHRLAVALFEAVDERPVVSIHSGLPARFLAENLPITDPLNLLLSHDQGIQALLRAHDVRIAFSPDEGWQTEQSRQAFALVWQHLVAVRGRPWMEDDGDHLAELAGLPPFRDDQSPQAVYEQLRARLTEDPIYPRATLAAADLGRLFTSEDPSDDLRAQAILAEDPAWGHRVCPSFSPDRYLQPGRQGWRTDAELLAELTGIDTADLNGFLAALRERRGYFIARGATLSEHHAGDVGAERLPERAAADLYALAHRGELLPAEALTLQRHLLWETGGMAADDGLIMALYPPAGFHAGAAGPTGDEGVTARVRPLVDDFGSRPGFRLWLFSTDPAVYADEVIPLAASAPCLTAVPPTRFADDPDDLRAVRREAVRRVGIGRTLGIVDDMSGPFAILERHRLGRRLDASALAESVVAGELDEHEAYEELSAALDRSILAPRVGPAA